MPLLETPEPARASSRANDRRFLPRRVARIGLRIIALLLVSALIGGSWYLAKRGFGRQWRYRVVEELRKHGVEASVRRLTLDPFRGLVAQDVRIFDYHNRENTLARISEIALDINYAALLHRQPFLNALDIRNAQLALPLKSPEGMPIKAQVTNIHAHVYFPPEQIYLSQAEGIFCGVRISATGQLIKRENYQPSAEISNGEWQNRVALFQRVVAELGRFTYPGTAPRLQIKFTGDLAQLEDARMDLTLRADRIQSRGYEAKGFSANAEWAEQKLNLAQCEWRDDAGAFAGRASWSRSDGKAEFQARSTLDLRPIVDALGLKELFRGIMFLAPPLVEISGSFSRSDGRMARMLIGRVAIGNFSYKNIPFVGLTGDFSWDGERTMLREVHLQDASGEATAELFDAPKDFRLNLESTINPGVFAPLAPEDLRKFLGEWEWQRSPSVRLSIHGTGHDPASWTGDGPLALQRTRFRGVWMNSATGTVRFGNGAVACENFRVTRDEGVGTGSFTYDFAKHEVRIENVKSTLRPADAIFWVEPKLWKDVAPYRFRQSPNVTVTGVVQFRGGKNTHLEIGINSPGGMDYTFMGKSLPFDSAAGQLLFTDDRLQLQNVEGALFSGAVRGGADISLAKTNPHYSANLAVSRIDFSRLTDLYFKYQTAHGKLSAVYDFSGLGSESRSMRGSGKVEVTDGDVFAIPIFGPLSDLLGKFFPQAGYSIARKATADFTVKQGVIHTENLNVAGKLFGMLGHGDVHFADDKLDLDVRINANGPGFVLLPVYKLFEYKGEGSLSKPTWRPKRLPSF
jgi:AsmA-like C-terminal region